MLMMRSKHVCSRAVVVLMGLLFVIASLAPFAAGVSKAFAGALYEPIEEVKPAYTGPLSWNHYSPKRNTSIIPTPGTYNYTLMSLDIDDSNNIYTVGQKNPGSVANLSGVVEKVSENGQTVDITYNSNLYSPRGIAVDKYGNVYVTDNSSLSAAGNVVRILKLPYGTKSWVNITNGQTFRFALGIATDNQGNVFVTEYSGVSSTTPSGKILMLPSGGSSWSNITGTTSFYAPWDIAADGEGNVFVSDSSPVNGKAVIYKRPPAPPIPDSNNSWTNVAPEGQSSSFQALGISVDKFDNLYAIGINGGVHKLSYNGGQNDWTSIEIANSTPGSAYDVAADSSGYLYIPSLSHGNVSKLMASITYNANGGIGTSPIDPVGYGPNATAPVSGNTGNLVKTGYLFAGWATSSSATAPEYVPGGTITMTQSVTLYAVWTPKVTITYDGNGSDSGTVPSVAEHGQGEAATVSGNTGNLAKTGYLFAGWAASSSATAPEYVSGDAITMTQSVTLYAVWTPKVTITYDGNGSDSGTVPSVAEHRQGETATVSGNAGNLAKTGYLFAGWATSSSATAPEYVSGDTITMTQSVTLYAVWTPKVTITYDGNGSDSGAVPSVSEHRQGETATVSGNTGNLAKTGYLFAGWSTSSSATAPEFVSGDTITMTQNVTLYAVWIPKFTVTYDGNGSDSGTVPSAAEYRQGETATVSGNTGSLAKTGYLFAGWSTSSSAIAPEYVSGDTITMTQNVTLYAVWIPKFTVTYDGNGSDSGTVPTVSEHRQGETATVSGNTGNLAKTGYLFAGWATSSSATAPEYVSGDKITMTQNVTLYAVWTSWLTITYDGNGNTGGSVPVDLGIYRPGVTAVVYGNSNNLTRTGYTFDGWNMAGSVTERTYAPGDIFTVTHSVTFNAKWNPIPSYTVSYQAGTGGSLDGSVTESVYSGSSPQSVPAVTPEPGYMFLGWSKDGGATLLTSVELASAIVEGDVTYTAYFKQPVILLSVTLDSDSYRLKRGRTHQSVTTAVYSNTSTLTLSSGVTYTSSNAGVASVSSSGLVTGIAGGQTVITAVYGGKQAQAVVTVYNDNDSNSSSIGGTTSPGVQIIVDGVRQDQLASAEQKTVNGQSVTTVTLDSKKVIEKLEKDNNNLITIPVNGGTNIVIGQLNASLVKSLQSKEAQIQIVTDKATYTLPASQINIDSISAQIGSSVKLEDITINIEISETPRDKAAEVEGAAQENGYIIVGAPVDFEVKAFYGTQTVLANQFNSYVERKIALPDGTDTSDVTTGVVWTEDRKLGHVPTVVVKENGKTYAVINSLTNSTYTVVYTPREMYDMKGHWAQADVNDMSSRLVVNGVKATEFYPEASITRAEFIAIVTRGLGIQDAPYAGSFQDVESNNWFSGAVQSAIQQKLIDGYEDGTFRPNQSITRQEATTVLVRAAKIANLKTDLPAAEVTRVLSAFKDGGEAADWARTNVAAAISLSLMNGRDEQLDVDADLTRAETAVLVRRLLQAAKLINF